MENYYRFERDPIGPQLKLSMITRDGFCLFMDCSELHKDLSLVINKQCFFSGYILVIEHDIACLKLNCITPAESLDLELYSKTRLIMDYVLKTKPLEGTATVPDLTTARPKNNEPMDIEDIEDSSAEMKDVSSSKIHPENISKDEVLEV